MKNMCLRCNNYINVHFEHGDVITYCDELKIKLKDAVVKCTEFYPKNKITQKLDEYQLWEYVSSIRPYIIEEKKKAGFLGEKEIEIRKATDKDKNNKY